ncbi:GIY-YIG nuclease family protein [Nonlabens tegetincola]|uniref:GIY-YIG nuclease family protein n=1 Tax=Nonlabens tegetincola TaxID=323273 RepID=UPI0011B0D13C|nr:hypothetical protein [Nonlabens tegetincola]
MLKAKTALSTAEIASVLNKTSWYTKKDGSAIQSSQISARVRNYPHLFVKSNGKISLKNTTGIVKTPIVSKHKKLAVKSSIEDSTLQKKILMNKKNFNSVADSEDSIPHEPGLYCVRIKNSNALPSTFQNVLKERKHNIIYIGLASKSLKKRFLNQELKAKGHGTFFRSLGALLGYVPESGSLKGKRNQNNYKFSNLDEVKIINWINENLSINWVTHSENLSGIEKELIVEYLPILNIAGNPEALDALRLLRKRCKIVALDMYNLVGGRVTF